jgi:hypothetical protein
MTIESRPFVTPFARPGLRISRAISSGWAISERWLAFTSIVFASHPPGHEALEIRIDGAIFR